MDRTASVWNSEDRAASRALEAGIRSQAVPLRRPGEREEALRLAAMHLSTRILTHLEELYGVETWDWPTFEEIYLRGALGTWRPSTSIRYGEQEVEISTPVCPLLEATDRDPDLCRMCQLTHEMVAYEAAEGDVRNVETVRTIVGGGRECSFVYHLSEDAPTRPRTRVLSRGGIQLGVLANPTRATLGESATIEILLDPEVRRGLSHQGGRLEVASDEILALRRDEVWVDVPIGELIARVDRRALPGRR